MKKLIISCLLILFVTSCVSTKSTIKNIDDSIATPSSNESLGCFIITKMSKDPKYGFNEDYPVNVGFSNVEEEGLNNQIKFLNALAGPNGEKIKYEKKDPCCPFPSKKSTMGAGMIDVYEVSWEGLKKPLKMYINKFEKGELMIPLGFSVRK